jgi:hypothetical protein
MRKLICVLCFMVQCLCYGQYPYVKKLNYPDQLPTNSIYDMLTDSKGRLWIGTDKGLYRFNGQAFVVAPFTNTSLTSVSYLQEDAQGKIWCMNFHNQLFYYQGDSLRRFEIDTTLIENAYSFTGVAVSRTSVWFTTFDSVYQFDKRTHNRLRVFRTQGKYDPIITFGLRDGVFYALSTKGYYFHDDASMQKRWDSLGRDFTTAKLINTPQGQIAFGTGLDRAKPVWIERGVHTSLPKIQLPPDILIFQAVNTGTDQYWLCTQNGAYAWDPKTGRTTCYLPGERVSDVVKDYQGNVWFSTLDNGIFICPSLGNTLYKIYKDPLLDNFTKVEALPSGNIVAGNSQGLLARFNYKDQSVFRYGMRKGRETEFIKYDTLDKIIITNRGTLNENRRQPLSEIEYSKGVSRDKYGNLLVAVFSSALVMNNQYTSLSRNAGDK